jgi:hypothetical protein
VKVARPGAGSVRGVFAGFLGLVALHAVGSRGGSGRIAEAFGDVAGVIERVLNPTVPAIPDKRSGAASATNGPNSTSSAAAVTRMFPNVEEQRLPIPAPPR